MKIKNLALMFTIIYFIIPLPLILTIFLSNTVKYSTFKYLLPMMLGAMAYSWLILEFVLSARPKFIERHFGMDRLYRFHGLMAVISVVLVFIHKLIEGGVFKKILLVKLGNATWIFFLVIVFMSLLFMADTFLLRVKLLSLLKGFATKFKLARYETQLFVHNLSSVALILMLIHVLMTTSSKMHVSVRLVFIVYFTAGAAFYIYHTAMKPLILKRNGFIITDVKRENARMWTLQLTPESGGIFGYKPGQFGFLRVIGNAFPEEHPFSISSDPGTRDFITITIKELGDFTSGAGKLSKGTKVTLDAPYGRFSPENYPDEESIVLIAGGVGITPAMSILRHFHRVGSDRRILLIWGINSKADLICEDEFDAMQKEMKNFFFVPVAFADDFWKGEKGRVDRKIIESILEKYDFDKGSSGFYICGPSAMLKLVRDSLAELAVDRRKIHFEKFSL